jgi:hypothetical protein
MTTTDRIDMLAEAQENLSNAIQLIRTALKGTDYYGHANAYIVPHLDSWIDTESYNMGIQQYMDALILRRDLVGDEEEN